MSVCGGGGGGGGGGSGRTMIPTREFDMIG